MTMTGGSKLTQGGVYLTKLNPRKGSEIGKVRAVVVLTNQFVLEHNPPLLFICPLSSRSELNTGSLHVELPPRDSLKKTSFALVEHCKSIDRERITGDRLTQLAPVEIKKIIKRVKILIDY